MPARKSSPSKRSWPRVQSRKAPPPLPPQAGKPGQTIEVDRKWLIPTIPEMAHPKKSEEPRKALPLPSILAVKPRGKLPPPIPREDHDSAEMDPLKSSKRGRPSKRPPRAR